MRIGLSLYPKLFSDDINLKKYLAECYASNLRIIFTTLIELSKNNQKDLSYFNQIVKIGKKQGFDVCVDLDSDVYDNFFLSFIDHEKTADFFLKEFNCNILRFDAGFTDNYLQNFTNNSKNIKVIINAANSFSELNKFLSLPNINYKNIWSCWNFYPQRYTGSAIELFRNHIELLHQYHIPVQAFVSIQRPEAVGPWAYNDYLPSLEFHRNLPLEFQIRHLLALGVDDAIIANQFLNDSELLMLKTINLKNITLKVSFVRKLSQIENKIMFDEDINRVRKDLAEYMHRSTLSRLKYKDHIIKPANNYVNSFKPGDIVILNSLAKNYMGELQIITKEMPNDGIRNLVGHLDENEQMIAKELKPDQRFILQEK